MPKTSLTNQLIHAVCECECYGQSRHRDKQGSDDISWKVYSLGEKEQLTARARDLGNFMKAKFPDIRRVVDIRQEHVQAWLDGKAETCAQSTIGTYFSNVKKISDVCAHVYRGSTFQIDRVRVPESRVASAPVKTLTMETQKLDLLISEMKASGTEAWKAPALGKACGLRIREAANVHLECVSLIGGRYGCGQITLRSGKVDGSKHGRPRTIEILNPAARNMVAECIAGVKPGQTIIRKADGTSYRPESLDRAISRAMDRIDKKAIAQGEKPVFGSDWKQNKEHSVRKAFAQASYDQRRAETAGCMREKESRREAVAFTNQQLGHGDTRSDSIAVYVAFAW